ncbi:MAG: 16S rRNA (cytosine(1402)-N(4))-methyltransferase RsmH [Candidatus Levyibacteriota bacterium]
MTFQHKSVLLQEVIENLNIRPGGKDIDATLGGGGHTKGIIDRGGVVLGIDTDTDALDSVKQNFQVPITNFQLKVVKGNFKDIKQIAIENGFRKVQGILFDLGVSSHQLDTQERGFSIKHDGPLDMRMDTGQKETAAEILRTYSREALEDIFTRYGEEEHARDVVEVISDTRKKDEIKTTKQLVGIIESVIKRQGKLHPATRIFQALRIEVNQELDAIKQGVRDCFELLDVNGRVVVISFHSLEDRIIKRIFEEEQRLGIGRILNKNLITASDAETKINPRARSAKMRIFEKEATI